MNSIFLTGVKKRLFAPIFLDKSAIFNFLRTYYILSLFVVFSDIRGKYKEIIAFRPEQLEEVVHWYSLFPLPAPEIAIMAGAVLSHIFAILFVEIRIFRALTFIFSLFLYARNVHVGSVNHDLFFVLYPLFFYSLIPGDFIKKFTLHEGYIKVCLHAAGLSLGLLLSIAGWQKILMGLQSLWRRELGLFSYVEAFNVHIAREALIIKNQITPLAHISLQYPEPFYVFFIIGVVIEAMSFIFTARPRFFPLFTIWYIGFQLSTMLLLDIFFRNSLLVIMFIFFCSPLREFNAKR